MSIQAPTSSAPEPELLLVALGMPDGLGLDLVRVPRRHWPRFQAALRTLVADTTGVPAAMAGSALSAREREVLALLANGLTYAQIAARLQVSRHTVHTFVRRLYAKLDVGSKVEAVNAARRSGILPP